MDGCANDAKIIGTCIPEGVLFSLCVGLDPASIVYPKTYLNSNALFTFLFQKDSENVQCYTYVQRQPAA